MKPKTRLNAWVAAAAIGASLSAGTAQTPANTSINPLSQAERAANLYGHELVGSDNQRVGKIDNVIVDLESEHILYVVVGASKGKVAVVPQAFGQTSGNTLRATVTKQKIEGAPQFTAEVAKPEQLGQARFVNSVYQYFGANAWWQGNTPADQGSFHNVHKLNQLIHLVTNIDRQKLASAPHFDKSNWPAVNDLSFASQVYQCYGKQAWFNSGGANYQPTGR